MFLLYLIVLQTREGFSLEGGAGENILGSKQRAKSGPKYGLKERRLEDDGKEMNTVPRKNRLTNLMSLKERFAKRRMQQSGSPFPPYPATECWCNDYVNENGYGRCIRLSSQEDPICYLNLGEYSVCRDKRQSNTNQVQWWSYQACQGNCSCSSFVNPNGFGNCSTLADGTRGCYVNNPMASTCRDLEASQTNPGWYWSYRACAVTPPITTRPPTGGFDCSCSNIMNGNWGRCQQGDNIGVICYVNHGVNSTCLDKEQSRSNPNLWWSYEACGWMPTTSTPSPTNPPGGFDCSCSNIMNGIWGRCQHGDNIGVICYVNYGVNSTCPDKEQSRSNPVLWWSYAACGGMPTTSTTTTTRPQACSPVGSVMIMGVADQCQRCTCNRRGSYECVPGVRERKEIHDLTDQEWNKYAAAINELKRREIWEDFSDLHTIPGMSAAHGASSHFLHWHRKFLYDVETRLIEISNDCSLALPYWDWANDPTDGYNSAVWNPSRFGSNNYGAQSQTQYCVRDGPFRNWQQTAKQFWWWDGPNGRNDFRGCLQRQAAGSDLWDQTMSPQEHQTLLNEGDFQDFNFSLEGFHNLLHVVISRHMAASGRSSVLVNGELIRRRLVGLSPYDPVFLSHHGFIDQIWDEWQKRHGFTDINNAVNDDLLRGFYDQSGRETITVRDMAYSERINNGGAGTWGVRYMPKQILARSGILGNAPEAPLMPGDLSCVENYFRQARNIDIIAEVSSKCIPEQRTINLLQLRIQWTTTPLEEDTMDLNDARQRGGNPRLVQELEENIRRRQIELAEIRTKLSEAQAQAGRAQFQVRRAITNGSFSATSQCLVKEVRQRYGQTRDGRCAVGR